MNNTVVSTILKAVALGMGVVVIVLAVMNVLATQTGVVMLGIGLTAIALQALQKK